MSIIAVVVILSSGNFCLKSQVEAMRNYHM